MAGSFMPESDEKTFLCYYAQDHVNFRLPELCSVCSCTNAPFRFCPKLPKYEEKRPYLVLETSYNSVKKIASRSILMRYIIELWAHGSCWDDIVKQKDVLSIWTKNYLSSESETFKIDVEAFDRKLSIEGKKEWINSLGDILDIPGNVNLSNPTHTLCLLLDFHSNNGSKAKCNYIYFGRLVAKGQRDLLHKFSLKTRYFIGNTSMDPQLSFLMANQGKVKKGSFVFDPFVGTGSILTCCAQFGAFTAGSDIDRTIIYGRGKSSRAGNNSWRARDEIIRTNYQQYSLLGNYIDVMAADVTRIPLRMLEFFDAIITDPPYGIREGGRKLTGKMETTNKEMLDEKDSAFPTSSLHQLSDIILDLIHFAAIYLQTGGRLVFWLPVYVPSYSDELIPKHPCFALISNTEQKLTSTISRRLITMEKTTRIQAADSKLLREYNEEWKLAHNKFRENYFKGKS